jgi:hypothetical protein
LLGLGLFLFGSGGVKSGLVLSGGSKLLLLGGSGIERGLVLLNGGGTLGGGGSSDGKEDTCCTSVQHPETYQK